MLTTQIETEDILATENRFINAVLETVGALVMVMDPEGRIVRFNRACKELTGYTFAEIKDRYWWDILLIPGERDAVKKVFQSLKAGNFPSKYENYWIAKDESLHLIAWSNTCLVNARNEVSYIIGTGIEITEKKFSENALQRSEEEKTAILDHIADCVLLQDLDHRIIWGNQAAARSFGRTQEEIKGEYCYQVRFGNEHACDKCPVHHSTKTGKYEEAEVEMPDGRTYLIRGCPLRDSHGEVYRMLEVATDITDVNREQGKQSKN